MFIPPNTPRGMAGILRLFGSHNKLSKNWPAAMPAAFR